MIATRTVLTFALGWVIATVMSPTGFAQVINAPIPSSGNTVTQATGDFDNTELSEGIKQTAWPSIPWPTITMPKITMPKLPPLWPSDSNSDSPALLQPFFAGYSKVAAGGKKAWEGTKDLFSVFQSKDASKTATRTASKPKTSFWQRLTTRKTESQAPQTVGEFMRQPRNLP